MTPMILLWMIFCHVVDDYYLQGCLAQLKQRSYWEKNAPEESYENDYIAALLAHGFSWAFMIMLPILIYQRFDPSAVYYLIFGLNWVVHSIVDDLKANKKKINLITDQSVHLMQIVISYFILSLSC